MAVINSCHYMTMSSCMAARPLLRIVLNFYHPILININSVVRFILKIEPTFNQNILFTIIVEMYCIAMIQLYVYTHICGNIINNNDERTHLFRKIYLSHFIRKGCERVVCERWVGDWTDCNILTPSSSVFSSNSFSFCWPAQPGVLRAQTLCWELVLTA